MDAHDHDLLTRFRANRDEAAFRHLVDRHIGMVYSVARRVTDNTALAEEVAQATFTKLADKSAGITRETALAGWLYQTSRRLALSAVRSDARRRQREQIAAAMNLNEPSPTVVAEYLEPAMDQLAPDDRDALLLRFFEDRTLRDVGQELGLSEDAARMRVNRAIEKMRDAFAKLGITGTAAWLGTTLTTSATASVPAGLGATITTTVLAGTAIAAATTALVTETTATTMNLFNLKTAAAILGAAAVTGTTTYLVQEREAEQLRTENTALNQTHAKLASDQQEALTMIQLRDEQIERLKRDVADLPRLRGEIDATRRKLAELDSLRIDNQALREAINRLHLARNSTPDASLEELEPLVDRKQYEEVTELRVLGLLLVMYADDNNGMLPTDLSSGGPMAPYYAGTLKGGVMLTDRLDMNAYEVLVTGDINQLPAPSRTIIARQKNPTFRSGAFQKLYVFADGHTEYGSATTLMELDAWERQRFAPANQ